MKRIIFLILALLLVTLALPGPSHSAWTVDAARYKGIGWTGESNTVYVIKVTCEIDGSAADEFSLSTYLSTAELKNIAGGILYQITTDQGTSAPEVYTVTFDDGFGADLYSITTTETTQAETFSIDNAPIILDLQIDFGDAGDSGEDIVLYLFFMK